MRRGFILIALGTALAAVGPPLVSAQDAADAASAAAADAPGAVAAPRRSEGDQIAFADGLFSRGFWDLAADEYRTYLERFADGALRDRALYRLAESRRALGQSEQALGAYRTVVARYPDSEWKPWARFRVGELLFRTGAYEDAETALRELIDSGPDPELSAAARYTVALAQAKAGNAAAARASFAEIADLADGGLYRGRAWLQLGLLALDGGDPAAARTALARAGADAAEPAVRFEALVRLGDLEFADERFEPAAAAYRGAVRTGYPSPSAQRARIRLLWSLQNAGRHADCIRAAADMLDSIGPDGEAEVLYVLGNAHRQLGNYGHAVEIFDRIVKEFPGSEYVPAAQYEAVLSAYRAGMHPRTVQGGRAFSAAFPDADQRSDVLYMVGDALYALERYEEAVETLATLLREDPDAGLAPEAAYRHALALWKVGRGEEAAVAFRRFAEERPGHPLAVQSLMAAARCRMERKEFAEARRDLTTLVDRAPRDPVAEEAWMQLGICAAQLEDWEGVRSAFRSLLEAFPSGRYVGEARFWLGTYAYRNEDWAEAVQYLERAVTDSADASYRDRARLQLGLALHELKQFDRAAEHLNALVSTRSGELSIPPDVYQWLGRHLMERKRHADALKVFSRLLSGATEPRWIQAGSFGVAEAYRAQGRLEEARSYYQRAADEDSSSVLAVRSQLALGDILAARGDPDGATRAYEAVLAFSGADVAMETARALIGLGGVYESARRFEDANRAYLRVAILYDEPTLSPRALLGSVRCLQQLGRLAEAERTARELLERYPKSAETEAVRRLVPSLSS